MPGSCGPSKTSSGSRRRQTAFATRSLSSCFRSSATINARSPSAWRSCPPAGTRKSGGHSRVSSGAAAQPAPSTGSSDRRCWSRRRHPATATPSAPRQRCSGFQLIARMRRGRSGTSWRWSWHTRCPTWMRRVCPSSALCQNFGKSRLLCSYLSSQWPYVKRLSRCFCSPGWRAAC